MPLPPILANKAYLEAPVFTAANLLREARRQKGLPVASVPRICVLDPDGDIVRALVDQGRAGRDPAWACYHTDLFTFSQAGVHLGVIGCAVGAAFAVLVAEELFAAGCQLLISITSSGQIQPRGAPPYFILIERAVRDEGVSYHYQPPATYSMIQPALLDLLAGAFDHQSVAVQRGATWTTDAPFRETASAIAHYQEVGVDAVEMEAAALYAFAAATKRSVVCFAHVTNLMAQFEGDFEKGAANGSEEALAIIGQVAHAWLRRPTPPSNQHRRMHGGQGSDNLSASTTLNYNKPSGRCPANFSPAQVLLDTSRRAISGSTVNLTLANYDPRQKVSSKACVGRSPTYDWPSTAPQA